MKKKVLGLVLAIAMTLSLAAPAFATNYYNNTDTTREAEMEQSITFNAITFVPTVKLYVPTFTGNPVVLNPYKIKFSGTTDNTKLAGQTVADSTNQDQYKQVICPVYAIKNQTDAPLKYAVEATTTPTGVELQEAPVSVTATEKLASLQLVVATSGMSKTDYGDGHYGNSANEQQLDQFDVSKYEVLKLTSGAVTSVDSIEKILEPGSGSGNENYLLFQFQGTMTRSPTVAWTNSDKVDCVVKFTFTPDSANDYTVAATNKIVKDSTAIGNTDGEPTGTTTIELPTKSGGPATTDLTLAKMVAQGAPNAASDLKFAEDPKWAIVSSGALAKAGLAIDAGVLTIDHSVASKRLPKDNTSHNYKIVLSFEDEHKIPRTVDFLVALKRASS